MRNLILTALMLFTSIPAVADFSFADQQYFEVKNQLLNPGFEQGKAHYTASAGVFTTSVANAASGAVSGTWDPSATSQTLRTELRSVNYGEITSKPCLAKFRYRYGDTNITAKVLDNSGNTLVSQVLSTQSDWTLVQMPFLCTASGTSIRISFESTADAAIMAFDDLYLGYNYLVGQVSQAQFAGQAYIATTLNCTPARTNTALGAFTLDTDCPGPTVEAGLIGDWQTTDTDLPKFTINNLPPGIYEVAVQVPITVASSGTGCIAVNDGTTTSGVNCYQDGSAYVNGVSALAYFNYTTAGNRTFEIYGANSAAAAITLDNSSGLRRTQISIRRFPATTETALRVDQSGWRVDANIAGANASLGITSQSTYIGIENGSLSLTQNPGSTLTYIPCSSTNDSTGTTCSAGNESVGVAFTIPFAGDYRACVSFAHQLDAGSAGATGGIDSTFQLVETPNAAQTQSQEGKSRVQSGYYIQNVNQRELNTHPNQLCGNFTFSSVGKKTIRLFYEQVTTGTVNSSTVLADGNVTLGQRDVHWEVYPLIPWSQNPLILNSIVTQASGVYRMEAAKLNCDSGSAITSQDGTWVSSIGNVASGVCAVTLTAGVFSTTPYCWISDTNVAGTPAIMAASASSSTAVSIDCADNAGTACTAYDVNLFCRGQK